jgi:hypothetical protein
MQTLMQSSVHVISSGSALRNSSQNLSGRLAEDAQGSPYSTVEAETSQKMLVLEVLALMNFTDSPALYPYR